MRLIDSLRRACVTQTSHCGTTVMKAYFVWECRPREALHVQVVMQELNQFKCAGSHFSGFRRLINRVEMAPDMVDTASGRPHDRFEVFEAINKEFFSGGGILLAAAVSHGLSATGLLERIINRAA